jgi:hypothetical protein
VGTGDAIRLESGIVNLRASVLDNAAASDNCNVQINSLGSNVADDATCFSNAGSDKAVANVLLGPLKDNGGPTQTLALLPGSPAIDAVVGTCVVDVDQRGFDRPVDGDHNGAVVCDSGAFEFGAEPSSRSETSTRSNDEDDKPKETREQQQQRERTNRSDLDEYRVEGNVMEVHADADPPYVVIANRDGLVKVVLLGKDAAIAADSIKVGDYLEADGEKQNELLFEAESVSVKHPR